MPAPADLDHWHLELAAGRGVTHNGALTSVAAVDFIGRGQVLRGFLLSPQLGVARLGAAPGLGDGFARPVWLLAAGGRLEVWRGGFVSFQLGLVDRITPAFSSRYQFISTAGWSGGHFTVSLRHVSNGSLQGPNYGETALLAGLRF